MSHIDFKHMARVPCMSHSTCGRRVTCMKDVMCARCVTYMRRGTCVKQCQTYERCVAVCCSVLQVLQCIAVCCSVLQCVAVCCSQTRTWGETTSNIRGMSRIRGITSLHTYDTGPMYEGRDVCETCLVQQACLHVGTWHASARPRALLLFHCC